MKRKIATKDLVLTALFAALTAVLAQIQLPIGPVPFNLAVFGAFLAGMLLAPAWAAASMGVYMLLGAVGIPVFAGFMGGPAVLLGKTGGYVIGYIFIALATALAVKRSGKLPVIGAAMLAGLLICYGFGTAWFMAVTGAEDEYQVCQMVQVTNDLADYCRKNGITDGTVGMRSLLDWVTSAEISGDPYASALDTIISKATADEEDREALITSVLDPVFAPKRRKTA